MLWEAGNRLSPGFDTPAIRDPTVRPLCSRIIISPKLILVRVSLITGLQSRKYQFIPTFDTCTTEVPESPSQFETCMFYYYKAKVKTCHEGNKISNFQASTMLCGKPSTTIKIIRNEKRCSTYTEAPLWLWSAPAGKDGLLPLRTPCPSASRSIVSDFPTFLSVSFEWGMPTDISSKIQLKSVDFFYILTAK